MIGRRKAFTLVELLVVIAIIGIFVSLLLPAVQASRESARRVTCTNQLRYLIVAVHDYELAHGHLPAGTVNPTGPILNLPDGHHISWIAHILPYIDEPALYSHLDLSLSAYHQANDRARQTTVSGLSCPSSSEAGWPFSNYAGCHHDVETPIDSDNQGVFFLNSRLTREDLKDGTAYTLFLGEKLADEFDRLPGTLCCLLKVRPHWVPITEFDGRQLDEPLDGCQEVIEIVRNSSRHLPDRFQLVRLSQARLQVHAFRDVVVKKEQTLLPFHLNDFHRYQHMPQLRALRPETDLHIADLV
jgi:prepilin-type N-terminal cleavage/methylation domain-containing protein